MYAHQKKNFFHENYFSEMHIRKRIFMMRRRCAHVSTVLSTSICPYLSFPPPLIVMQKHPHLCHTERWGAGVETQKNVRGEIEGWGRVPFNEPYAPSLITICDGA